MQYQIIVNSLLDYVDLFICETMSTIAESESAIEAAMKVMRGTLFNGFENNWQSNIQNISDFAKIYSKTKITISFWIDLLDIKRSSTTKIHLGFMDTG